MWKEPYTDFFIFLEKNLLEAQHEGGSGMNPDFPEFDLMPHDYLNFAEEELDKETTASRINCITHLKRAIECERDTFIHVFNIQGLKNFPSKLDFADNAGLFSSRSIRRLNQIRNKLEHEYADPSISDLTTYYDVASGLVHSIEGCMFILLHYADSEWSLGNEDAPKLRFGCEMDCSEQAIKFWWKSESDVESVTIHQKDGSAFTFTALQIDDASVWTLCSSGSSSKVLD
jgi:hypothetical protein